MPCGGRGGGASGRAVAFCPSKPRSNPGTDLAFSGSELVTGSILAGRRAFSKERRIEDMHTLPSSFLFPITIAKK